MTKTYTVNELFLAPQGEGGRAGEMSVFVRFTGCNLRCDMEPNERSPGGFQCDTEFESGRKMTGSELISWCEEAGGSCRWIVFTGGEPTLQLDTDLIALAKTKLYKLAIETNGLLPVPPGLDWICVSPKMAEHTLKQLTADEVKYVRHYGQGIPRPRVTARLKYISPAYRADGKVDPKALEWCLKLIHENPEWRISEQQHKRWPGVR